MKNKKPRPSSRQRRVLTLVQQGHRLYRQLAKLTDELKAVEGMLRTEALNRTFEHLPRVDSANDTLEWTARGQDCECRVIFPGLELQRDFPASHPELPTIKRICGSRFGQLFTEAFSVQIADPDIFRQQVAHLFTPDQGTRLLRLCSLPSEPRIVWNESRRSQNA